MCSGVAFLCCVGFWLGESDAPFWTSFQVFECVMRGVKVALGWVLEVACKQTSNGCDVGTSAEG